jgi:hypothetical protein
MPVALDVRVEAAGVLLALRNGQRRASYAVVNSVNATIKLVQPAVRGRVTSRLTVRKSEFIKREAGVIRGAGGGSGFASVAQSRFQARIQIGEKDRLLLGKLETGGTRPSFGGGRRVAVPRTGGPARPSFASPVPASLRVQALRLIKVRRGQVQKTRKGRSKRERRDVAFKAQVTSTGKVQIKGRQRTFILERTSRAPEGGIFQRVGPKRDDIRLIYPFVAGPRLKKMLEWIQTAHRTALREFGPILRGNVRKELGRALRVNLGG